MNIICEEFNTSEEKMLYYYNELIRCYIRYSHDNQREDVIKYSRSMAGGNYTVERQKEVYREVLYRVHGKCIIACTSFLKGDVTIEDSTVLGVRCIRHRQGPNMDFYVRGVLEANTGGFCYRFRGILTWDYNGPTGLISPLIRLSTNGAYYNYCDSYTALHHKSDEELDEIYNGIIGRVDEIFSSGDAINYFITNLEHVNTVQFGRDERDVLEEVAIEIGYRMALRGQPFVFIRC